MIPKRFVLSTLGLPLLALACSPVTRTFDTGSGGATASSVEASSASSGGAGGSGGSGGGAPTGTCTKVDAPFDILSSDELGKASLSNFVLLAPDQESLAMVHVILSDYAQSQTLVRTVVDDVQRLGNFSHFGDPSGGPVFHPEAVWAGGGHLHLEGYAGNNIDELNFDVDPTKGVGATGNLDPYITPIECLQSGTLEKVVFAQDGEKARYIAVCQSITAGANSLLFSGGWTGKPVQVASDVSTSVAMHPTIYSFFGGEHLVFFTTNDGFNSFSHGATVDQLANLQSFSVVKSTTERQGIFTVSPRTADDGATFIGAHFDINLDKGEYWTGSTRTKDYATLAQVPPPGFSATQSIPTLKDGVTPSPATWNKQGVFSAGTSPDDKSVRLFWLTREGQALAFGQEIYKSADTSLRAAAAAPWGDTSTLVVWLERTTSAPFKELVRGQRLSCKLD